MWHAHLAHDSTDGTPVPPSTHYLTARKLMTK